VAHTPESVAAVIAQIRTHAERAGRDFTGFEITVAPGVRVDVDATRAFAQAGVQRLIVFSPGFVPRAKIESELFPVMERFVLSVMGSGDPGGSQ
jgi:alkanesulfonate monooxygenase SsuD/methylene tetrahydromethanopterin reductase-like flavin-dependent oxidoreductase (luciferase family)